MSYDRIGNYRIRDVTVRDGKEVRHKRSIFDKVGEIRQAIKSVIPEVRDEELMGVLSHCRQFYLGKLHYGRDSPKNRRRKRDLTMNERAVYDYILRHNLNPETTYRWFLATRLPQDLREELSRGRIGQKLAMQLSANRRRAKESTVGLLMIEEIRSIIEKLDWQG